MAKNRTARAALIKRECEQSQHLDRFTPAYLLRYTDQGFVFVAPAPYSAEFKVCPHQLILFIYLAEGIARAGARAVADINFNKKSGIFYHSTGARAVRVAIKLARHIMLAQGCFLRARQVGNGCEGGTRTELQQYETQNDSSNNQINMN